MRVSSTKPRKQRKLLYNAPAHVRHKLLSAALSPELRETYRTRSLPVRKGDTVVIVRGDYAGMEGKIREANPQKRRIFVEGATREKVDGSPILVPIHPSKVMIKKLDLGDKWRKELLKKKAAAKPVMEERKVERKPKVKRKAKTKKKPAKKAEKDRVKEKPAG